MLADARRRGLHVGAAVAAMAAACGARTPLLWDQTCAGEPLPVVRPLPTMTLVLDHSRSMELGDKWGQVRKALAQVMIRVGERARFATVIFPAPGGGICATGVEVMPPVLATPATVASFLQVTSPPPAGGTPTAATLLDLAGKLAGARDTFVLLATDGGPNCNTELRCGVETCILNIEGLGSCTPGGTNCCVNDAVRNCLDDARAFDAVTKLRAAGIESYIVGIPGSDVYGPVLDEMAVRGGTARPSSPRYWRVESTEGLAAALEDIASRITKRCVLTLAVAPKRPAGVRVAVRGSLRGEFTLEGSTLTLLGQACSDFDGDLDALRVADGCVPGTT